MMHPVCSLYYVGCLGAMGHLLWQVNTAKFDDVKNLSHRFRSNSVVGAIMLGSCVMGNVGLLL
jgi:4-hydroxybenzoate polyprenyltransferase